MTETHATTLPSHAWWTPRRLSALMGCFLAVGVLARLTRYLLRFPLWEDEAALAYNVMRRGYRELLEPLDFGQAAPLGYLWLQRAVLDVLGFSEWTLRSTALVAALASLFVLWRVAALTLPRLGQIFAVAVFAVSYPMIRYSSEAKQYGMDLFLGLCLIWCVLEAMRAERRAGWLAGLLALAAMGPFLSHPFAFVGGAVSLYLLGDVWRSRTWPAWIHWLAFNVLLATAFLVHLKLAQRGLGNANSDYLQDYWGYTFPPIREFWKLLAWILSTHSGWFLAFPVGSGHGGSTLTFLAVVGGIVLWARERRFALLTLVLTPVLLHFVAAALQRYPYGGHIKFSMYWVPCASLLMGAGIAAWCAWWDRRRSQGRLPTSSFATLGLLGTLALGLVVRDLASPTKTLSDQRSRDFVRWFWSSASQDEVAVCLHSDLARSFNQDWRGKVNWSAPYYCNLRIYSPRHARNAAPDWNGISEVRPLRCIEYKLGEYGYDEADHQAWLEEMSERYDLVSHDRFAMPRYTRGNNHLLCTDYIEVYKFLPKAPLASAK